MRRLCCTAQFVAALALAGCGTAELFTEYDRHESPSVENAPWPRLVDTPAAPAKDEFTAAAPDPARGQILNQNLQSEAALATARAESLSRPILSEAERAALIERARKTKERWEGGEEDPAVPGDG